MIPLEDVDVSSAERIEGYRATIKRGVITVLDDELTSERPSRPATR